ncbi:hypothetical protein [Dinghuibacter silviterrae]|uniref:Uncharacterized protein n=1 Tax=Dinghuibacter silviterrae TaxID=1539049 RepID=A0A4R8DTI5_9BACT|nr:hypothetical protein [Dinghuibacter silviterrae]TDX01216.1 hypothetical protein EDB95_2248 [Dinghuibacter silviterrae]
MRELSYLELTAINGGLGLPNPGALLSGLETDLQKTATDAVNDTMTTVNDALTNLGLSGLGLGGLGLGGL